jgi:hypothetical protein
MQSSGARSRIVGGILLIVAAVGLGVVQVRNVMAQADENFAVCGAAIQSLECRAVPRPMSVAVSGSTDIIAGSLYRVDVQTGKHTTFFLTNLTANDVAPLQGLNAIEVRYRHEQPVALIWPDGTPVQIPLAPTDNAWMKGLGLVLIAGFGALMLLWGIVRSVRGPRAVGYAY